LRKSLGKTAARFVIKVRGGKRDDVFAMGLNILAEMTRRAIKQEK